MGTPGGGARAGDREQRVDDALAGRTRVRVGVVTASDKGSRGERRDESGPAIADIVGQLGWEVVAYAVLPDERQAIAARLREMADVDRLDVVFTTGGTGFAARDITPEATLDVVERLVPGIPEAIRAESARHTPRAMLSRGVAGIRGYTLIINLPGSPRAVRECLASILPALPHGIDILRGEAAECARQGG